MNDTNNQVRMKGQVKYEFLAFFKTQESSHLASQKLKYIKQKQGESIWGYDRRLKDTLSLIPYEIEEKLLVQLFVASLLPQNRSQLWALEFYTYSNALKKALQLEVDEDIVTHGVDRQLEEKLNAMHKSIQEISLKSSNL